jgi:DNA-directed RNA polymerase specialized sigma24 family protein
MDREAEFRRLYDEHRSAVHAYLVGRLSGPQSSADLLQEVFMRVWRHLDTVTGLPPDQRGDRCRTRHPARHGPLPAFTRTPCPR